MPVRYRRGLGVGEPQGPHAWRFGRLISFVDTGRLDGEGQAEPLEERHPIPGGGGQEKWMRHSAQSLRNKDLRHLFFDTPEPHLYDTAPMSTSPDRPLDVLGLARDRVVVEREFPIAGFARLRDRLAEATGNAHARAQFGLAGQWPTAQLALEADVVLSCQRCLKPVRRKVASESRLVFASEDAPELPGDYEAIGGDPRMIDFAALVEDELLLGLPLVPRHEANENCTPPGGGEIVTGETPSTEMRRPFAGLKDLLKH